MTRNTWNLFGPNDKIAKYSQATLGDKWWQYTDTIPYTQHFGAFDDATDPQGRRGSIAKALSAQPLLSGNPQNRVLFIGGSFGDFPQGVTGAFTVNRTIVLPKGTSNVFFPIFNGNAANLTSDAKGIDVTNPFVSGGRNNAQLKDAAAYLMNRPSVNPDGNGTSALFASVDGIAVNNPFLYRQKTEAINGFSSKQISGGINEAYYGYQASSSYLANPELAGKGTITAENPNGYPTLTELGGYDAIAIEPVFADGYWLGVNLSQGEHILKFGGTFSINDEAAFAVDNTYNILNPIRGKGGDDALTGTQANDYIVGGNGKDNVLGRQGDDLIVGGKRADVLDGGRGADELWGDAGPDLFIFKRGYGHDAIFDFKQGDRIDIRGLSLGSATLDTLRSGISATQITFSNGNATDLLTLVGVQPSSLNIGNGFITL